MKTTNVYANDSDKNLDNNTPPMDQGILEVLSVHNSLWDKEEKLNYRGKTYDIYNPSHGGYSSVILPNENGYNFLWITQNLNKSTYGSMAILQARTQGDDKRNTWIVDNNNGTFKYVGIIATCNYFDGKKTQLIERYTEHGTIVVYSSDPMIVSERSRY
jgi:hypothetical protein